MRGVRAQITYQLEGKTISVVFNQSFWKGITDVKVFSAPAEQRVLIKTDSCIKSTTPSALIRAKEVVLREKIRLWEKTKS